MANKKPAPAQTGFKPTMTVIPSVYCDQYEFSLDNGLIGIRFGRRGETHADVTIPVNLIIDLANKLQDKILASLPTKETAQ